MKAKIGFKVGLDLDLVKRSVWQKFTAMLGIVLMSLSLRMTHLQ